MTEIQWAKIEPGLYEEMVAVLLSHINPEVRRIDGAGGDGGRDAEFPRKDGPEIFQLKSFTGRLNPSRRTQIKRSLERAAERSPVAWHLLVPIDPTPGEAEWFDALIDEYAFPADWLGKSWLVGQLAERDFIARYFLEGESERVLELLRELRAEEAAVSDLETGMKRMGRLAERINEIDPYYRFDIATREGVTEVRIVPRYQGAELDRPLTINMKLQFPNTEEGRAAARRFQEAMDFGSGVVIDASHVASLEMHGSPGIKSPSGPVSVEIGPPQPVEEWRLELALLVLSPSEVQLATLPLVATRRTAGRRGFTAHATDTAETFSVELRGEADSRKVQMHFRFSPKPGNYPHDLLPALRLMLNARSPNQVRMLVGENRIPLGEAIDAPPLPPIDEKYVRLVDHLARLQRETGAFFPMPEEFSPEDLREIAEAIDLLDGKSVEKPLKEATIGLNVDDPKRFLEKVADKWEKGAFMVEGKGEARVAGHVLSLGLMRTVLGDVQVANREDIQRDLAEVSRGEATSINLLLRPAEGASMIRSAVSLRSTPRKGGPEGEKP